MRRKIATVALSTVLVVSALAFLAPSAAASPLTNEGFEDGNFNGWSVYTYWGFAYVTGYYYPYSAPIGSYMAVLGGGYGYVDQTITQTAYFNAGDTLSGKVAAYLGDYLPYNDEVEVTVGGTTIYYRNVAMGAGYYSFVDVSWTAPSSGWYTVRISAMNAIDSAVSPRIYVDFGEPKPRTEIFREDFETGGPGWTSYGYNNLWHITQHRSVSPTHSMYYGRENYWDYDVGWNYGILESPPIAITGDNPQVSFEHWMETEGMPGWYDTGFLYILVNNMWLYFIDYWGDYYGAWSTKTYNVPASNGDTIELWFYFDTGDSLFNYYEGWYLDDVVVTVEGEPAFAELVVTDSGFMRPTIAAGGGGMAYVTVENIGDGDATVSGYSWGGADIAETQTLQAGPKTIKVGEEATIVVAAIVTAGTPEGATGLDFVCEYNSETGDPLEETVDINILWKETGGDRSEYVHSQDGLRHTRRLAYNIGAGNVADGGELVDACDAFLAGDYGRAKNIAVKPGGPGLGAWGLAPGQTQGNEGNGNGGLNG
jgi:hypothetical protein